MVIDSCLLASFKSWVSHGDICMSFIDGCGKTVPEMITDRCYCCKMTISWLCVTFLQFFMLFFECHQSSVSHGSFPFPTLIYLFLGFLLCLCFFLSQDKVITHTIRCKILFGIWLYTLFYSVVFSFFYATIEITFLILYDILQVRRVEMKYSIAFVTTWIIISPLLSHARINYESHLFLPLLHM